MANKEIDQISGTETTGHEWDGIKELNTPLPRWWLWTFYATVIWAIGYCILYPAIPLLSSATQGVLGYSSRAAVAEQMAVARQEQSQWLEQIEASDLQSIVDDPELFQFAVAGGRSAFAVNCSQCHGSGAAGSFSYPNLNDDEWLWGGTLDAIHHTIAHGIRWESDPDTRFGDMPAYGDGLLDRDQINDSAEYVLQLSGQDHDAEAAARGAVIYAEQCAACHGDSGEGIADLGAPALNNNIWLYGGDRDAIIHQITYARNGAMPSWSQRLDDGTIKKLVAYVYSLGGGQ